MTEHKADNFLPVSIKGGDEFGNYEEKARGVAVVSFIDKEEDGEVLTYAVPSLIGKMTPPELLLAIDRIEQIVVERLHEAGMPPQLLLEAFNERHRILTEQLEALAKNRKKAPVIPLH